MTRITYGLFRKGVREPNVTLTGQAAVDLPPTPLPTAMAAIGRFHRQGAQSALEHMRTTYRNSSYWGTNGPPQAQGWARAMIECFETYLRMAEPDQRAPFAIGMNRDVTFGANEIAVHIDVVLLDPRGYVGRLVFWDSGRFDDAIATDYATPVFAALEEELGAGRVAVIEVWHLRSRQRVEVLAGACLANLPRVERLAERIAR